MYTSKVFINKLIRNLVLSISIFWFAIACQNKNGSSSPSVPNHVVSKKFASGVENAKNDNDMQDDIDEVCDDECDNNDNKNEAGSEAKNEKDETPAEENKAKEDEKDNTEESNNDNDNDDKVNQPVDEPKNDDDNDNNDENDSESDKEKDQPNDSCTFILDECSRGTLSKKGREITAWPKNYTPLKPKNERTECCENLITRAHAEANEENKSAHKSRFTAKLLGVAPNPTSEDSCAIKNIYISYTPFGGWHNGKGPLGKAIAGTLKQARTCIQKNCKNHGLEVKSCSDRIAVVSFGNKNQLMSRFEKWNDGDKETIDNVNDMSSDQADTYPKVKLEMVQYMTYVYDPTFDKPDTKYVLKKNHAELLDSIKAGKQYVDHNGKRIPYMCERVLKTFKYVCPLTNMCSNNHAKWTRDRDCFVFFANDHGCSEHEGCNFKYINELMKKGSAPKRGILGTRPYRSGSRMVKMQKTTCDCSLEECLAISDFVFRLTIQYKDENGNVKTHVHENEMDYHYS